jgi:hypothetical protein
MKINKFVNSLVSFSSHISVAQTRSNIRQVIKETSRSECLLLDMESRRFSQTEPV